MTQNYTASFKSYDHQGYVVPEVEGSEGKYPAIEAHPANWLPVLRLDTKVEEYTVVAAGKVVAEDRSGDVVPAGLKFVFEAATGATILTYTANDYARGTVDLTTGVSYAVNGTTTYTQTQVTTALRARGLIASTETARDFISWPVGYAPYSYWQHCGGDGFNPALYRRHNFNLQHAVAVGMDRTLILPWVPAVVTTETQGGGNAIADTALVLGTGSWNSATGIAATTMYSSLVSAGDDVVAMVLNTWPAADITLNTPVVDSGSMLASMTEVDSIAALKVVGSGYFFWDEAHGVLFLYEAGGDAIPSGFSTSATITYYSYESAATGSSNIALVTGDLRPGTFLTFDDQSNLVPLALDIGTCYGGADGDAFSADPEYDDQADNSIISGQLEAFVDQALHAPVAQVIAFMDYPRNGLDKVMTQWTTLSATERMPGTATGGMSDALVQAGGADKMVIINFLSR